MSEAYDDGQTVRCDDCGSARWAHEPGCMNPMCLSYHAITPERRADILARRERYETEQRERAERQRLYAQSFGRAS